MSSDRPREFVFSLSRALLVAGFVLASAIALRMLSPDYISADLAQRALGVMLGMLVVVYANAVPKAMSSVLQARCDPEADQALRRFTGMSLVLGGVAYAVSWMLAPLQHAAGLSVGLLGSALLLVVARIGWGARQASRQKAIDEKPE